LRGGCGEFARANKARLRGRADLGLGHFLELIAPDSAGLENGCLRRVSVNQSELPPVAQRDDFAQPQFLYKQFERRIRLFVSLFAQFEGAQMPGD